MTKPSFQPCWSSRCRTVDSTRSSPTSSPAFIVRRTWAPSLVWFCTCQRNMSPTLMCTMSRSAQSSSLCVPLPLPCTPMITNLRTIFPSVGCADAQRPRRRTPGQGRRVDTPGIGDLEHVLLAHQHGRLVVEGGRQARVAFRRVGLAVPRRDLAGLAHVPEGAHQLTVHGPLPS